MAYLYCSEDGARVTDNMAPYEGELTVVTHGPLNRNDCRCDSCNRPLAEGEQAYLAEFTHQGGLHSQAGEFFDQGKAQVRLIAVETASPAVLMLGPDRQWVSHEEWAARPPSLLDRLKGALHLYREAREVAVPDQEIDHDR